MSITTPNKMTAIYPSYISTNEPPELTFENLPIDVLDRVLSFTVDFHESPTYETRHRLPILQDDTLAGERRDCNESIRVVG